MVALCRGAARPPAQQHIAPLHPTLQTAASEAIALAGEPPGRKDATFKPHPAVHCCSPKAGSHKQASVTAMLVLPAKLHSRPTPLRSCKWQQRGRHRHGALGLRKLGGLAGMQAEPQQYSCPWPARDPGPDQSCSLLRGCMLCCRPRRCPRPGPSAATWRPKPLQVSMALAELQALKAGWRGDVLLATDCCWCCASHRRTTGIAYNDGPGLLGLLQTCPF